MPIIGTIASSKAKIGLPNALKVVGTVKTPNIGYPQVNTFLNNQFIQINSTPTANVGAATTVLYYVMSSTDGENWTLKNTPGTSPFGVTGAYPTQESMVWTGTHYICALTQGGKIAYSADLISWTVSTVSATNTAPFAVCWDGGQIILFAPNGQQSFSRVSSNPGGSWTTESSSLLPGVGANLGLAWYLPSTSRYFVSYDSGTTTAFAAGTNYQNLAQTAIKNNGDCVRHLVTNGSGTIIAGSVGFYTGAVLRSLDYGQNWSATPSLTGASDNNYSSVFYDSTSQRFYAASYSSYYGWYSGAGSYGTFTIAPRKVWSVTGYLPASKPGLMINMYGYTLEKSTDGGLNWTLVNSNTSYSPNGYQPNTMMVAGNGIWVASKYRSKYITGGNTQYMAYATDPEGTWTSATIPAAYSYINFVDNTSPYFTASENGKPDLYISTNGATWTQRTPTVAGSGANYAFVSGNGTGAACAIGTGSNGVVAYTTNQFVNVTATNISSNITNHQIAYGSAKWVVVGTSNVTGATTCYTSPDGTTWTSRTIPNISGSSYASMAYSSGAGLFAFMPQSNTYVTSPDGITWTSRTLPAECSQPYSLIGDKYGFMFIDNGTKQVYKSTNGTSWTSINPTGYTNNWNAALKEAVNPYGNQFQIASDNNGKYAVALYYGGLAVGTS